jgi:hypothetical protein
MSAAEIRPELCPVYGQNVMTEGTVRQWCRMLKDGKTNVHDEDQSGLPSVMNDDLVRSVNQKSVKDGGSQLQKFHLNFYKLNALFITRS